VQLAQESIFAALEQLSASADVPLSVERILTPRLNEVISDPVFTAKIEAATLEEVLNWATALDPRYTWLFDGRMINLVSAAMRDDQSYAFNRDLDGVRFHAVLAANTAVFRLFEQIPGKQEQIAVLQTGGSIQFGAPWTTELRSTSVRRVMNDIARQLGGSWGWQLSGSEEFRVITFHPRFSGGSTQTRRNLR
jgi:hypothetical protein